MEKKKTKLDELIDSVMEMPIPDELAAELSNRYFVGLRAVNLNGHTRLMRDNKADIIFISSE
jgi:hypothetical protein